MTSQGPTQYSTMQNIQVPVPQYRLFTIHRDKKPAQLDLPEVELCKIRDQEKKFVAAESGFRVNRATFKKVKVRMLKAKRNQRLMMLSKATTSVASKRESSPPKEAFYCLNEPRRKETVSHIDFKFEEKPSNENEVPLNRKRIQKILSIFDERILKTKKLVDLREQKGCCKMFELLEKKNSAVRNQERNVIFSLNKTIKKLKDKINEVSEPEF